MTTTLKDAIDGAKLVRVIGPAGNPHTVVAWKGGHTVNYYAVSADGLPELQPTHTMSVGSFEVDEATREEVEAAIEEEMEMADL